MVRQAEENAEEDKKKREAIELRNEADQLIFTTDKTIKDLGEQVSEEEKQKLKQLKKNFRLPSKVKTKRRLKRRKMLFKNKFKLYL